MTSSATLLRPAGPAAADTPPPPPAPARTTRKFLPEVQGLRALAVLMVVAYHVWFGRISGGVDIFLLISAFLLTGQFTRRLEAGRPLELLKYWVHLFKRLLPLIAVTLLAVLGAAWLFFPVSRWPDVFGQAWASLFYYQNWYLAAESVDYYAAQHSVASPLQHFWSLSIQGQIFILWPLLFAVAALLAKLCRLRIRPVLIALFGAVFAGSLAFSITSTATHQAFAYFDTRARLWEFALGSLLALLLPYLKLGRGVRIVLGWAGLVAMFACGIVLQVGQQFPGYMALWPTLAAAAIIVAGFTDSRLGADRLLSLKPLVKLGDSSYALYLFHWPALVFYLVVSGNEQAGLVPGLVIVLGSVAAAILATKFIDAPIRRSPWIERKRRRAVTVILVCVALVATPLAAWQHQLNAANEAARQAVLSQAAPNNPGAISLLPDYVDRTGPDAVLVPSQLDMPDEWPRFEGGKCRSDGKEMLNICNNGIEDGEKSLVVLGSSHAHVWNTPLLAIAKQNNWSVNSYTKGFCPLGDDLSTGITESCQKFNEDTMSEVVALHPDLVVTTSTLTSSEKGEPEVLEPSWVAAVGTLNTAGIPVLAIRDTPRFANLVPECVEESPEDLSDCGSVRSELFAAVPPTDAVAGSLPETTFVDFTDYFCDATTCPAVIGNVIVYKDDNHVTSSYLKTMTPIFERELHTATGWDMK
ncbi:peptidoglycan/LPS O-acetylase OafA/YrhL [Arthrobacter stackebrandtii]|uniref:Peptidoglycan/LPS O-acetylase OafA/YrhL n=1 Tax=Arthrobacter stackebrandtii TaxID=272161 RepID=A0ABS4YY70_9MICC|nr:acyltransferase family protein [Arthrobacter stackebrandtii]MBP2413732.1 peptidoglycan/LPS O-acetylase OafA/YrhL [Arthrobacter stackebrandtii]PYH00025.1 acyltransferase [Arthrobacter stackebrandtii]